MSAAFARAITMAFILFKGAVAAAIPASLESSAVAPVQLAADTIASFKPFTYYAAAAYCEPEKIMDWGCGRSCSESPNFKPTAAGGDGNGVQYWYTGYDSNLQSAIVAHQGTDPTRFLSLLTDAQLWQTEVPVSMFPGIPSGVRVHHGFLNAHLSTLTLIKAAVANTTAQFNTTKVTFVGHSLGGAIAMLDAAHFKTHEPSLQISLRTYGVPRVGNAAWANWVDTSLADQIRITNTRDPIAISPALLFGYKHTGGEIHAVRANEGVQKWYSCAGQDNTNRNCSIGDTPSLILSNILDHLGPYDGIEVGACWLHAAK